jgi:LPXTG-motif cell wall-anchored protein
MRNSARPRIIGLASSLAAGLLCLAPSVHADQWDKKTTITLNAPVQIPTTTLQPGTYTLRLLDSLSNRHIVTVWDGTGMKHITTVLAIPNYRVQPTGKSTFTFWETPADEPKALRAWFYPGDNFGQEFAYPKQKASQLAALNGGQTVPSFASRDNTEQDTAYVPDPEVTAPESTHAAVEPEPAKPAPPVETPTPSAEVEPEPAPTPAPEPEPAPAPAPPQEPAAEKPALPQTASNWAGILGAGVFAAAAGTATFRRRRRVNPES